MASGSLLGEDGRGYELARKLECQGVWRTWLGDTLYSNTFVHYLSSPSTWEAFMRPDESKTKSQIQLQLRARALLFDKASVSLFLRHSSNTNNQSTGSSSVSVSKLNPNYLQLHGDDVYFTLENGSQERESVGASNAASSKVQLKSAYGIGSRYGESERFKHEELPEIWYAQFFEKYKSSKSYRLACGDRETERRTPEQMSSYLKILERHKKRRVALREDQNMSMGHSVLENGSSMRLNSVTDESNAADDEAPFLPETMFTMNCVPDSAIIRTIEVQQNHKIQFNGVLDNLPRITTKSAIMIERLGIRPEYLNRGQGGNQTLGKNGSQGSRKTLSQEQASQMSQKVIASMLANIGVEGSSEVPLEVLAKLLSCHITKLGRILKHLADSYRKQCSAIELLKMFLQTAGHSNLAALSEFLKNNTRNVAQQSPQQMQVIQSQLQPQHQPPIRQLQQSPRHMHPQMQQMNSPLNLASQTLAYQQQQQWERLRRRQQSAPRPSINMTPNIDKPMVQVKLENPSDFPNDSNVFAAMNSRHPQLQQLRQQQLASIPALHAQSGNQFRPMASLPIPQVQSPNMGMVRAQPVKVEGFQELMGGDSGMKIEPDENRLTSPPK